MKKNIVEIDSNRCKSCLLCLEECRQGVLAISEEINRQGYHPVIAKEMDKCTGCTLCAIACPDAVITVKREEQ